VLLCAGKGDPTVFYDLNTKLMGALWVGLPAGLVTVLDVDSAPTGASDPFAAAKVGFAQSKTATINAAIAAGKDPAAQVAMTYHGGLVPPFCNAAARGFFSQF